jgi:hypothetical protein
VLAADREQVVIAGLLQDEAWGILTDDPAIAALATEFIRFDIVVQHYFAQTDPSVLATLKMDDQTAAFIRKKPTAAGLLRRLAGAGQSFER